MLLDLIREMDEPTRQRFWERLAPPGIATTDLRYPSTEDFLEELAEFVDAVAEGEYLDEEAQAYYGEDSFDNDYYGHEYDPDKHEGLLALRNFFREADSYFAAGRYEVAGDAYEQLIGVTLNGEPYETMGITDPLPLLKQDPRDLGRRYLVALSESRAQAAFFEAVLDFLAPHDQLSQPYYADFMELIGAQGQTDLQAYLQAWADELAQQPMNTFPFGLLINCGCCCAGMPPQVRLRRRERCGCVSAVAMGRCTCRCWPIGKQPRTGRQCSHMGTKHCK